MMRAVISCLLLLLLATAWVDDAVAAATPDPADDLIALQDNEYPPAPARPRDGRGDPLPPCTPPAGPAAAPAPSPGRPAPAPAPAGPPLCYVHMSLRR